MDHDAIAQYVLEHIDGESPLLQQLYRETHVHFLRPRMAAGHLQGRILKMLVEMMRPKLVLEIGTFTGYATLCMAEGLPDGGIIHTFEINDEVDDFTRPYIEGSPWKDRIVMHVGDALTLAPQLGLTFDMAYIDGDKRQYADYYAMTLACLSPGGYILADNTLWDGHVVDPAYQHDAQTIGVARFNDLVAADTRVEKVILPLRDGLTIIRKII